MGGYAAIVAVLLSTLLRCGNTVPVQGDTHNVANVSKPIISSASVNTPAGGMVFNHVYNINVPPVLCAGADGKVTQTSGTVEVGEGGDGAPFLANTFVPGGGSGGCCNNGGSGSGGDLLNGETGSLVTALQESTEDLKKQLAELLKEFEQFKQSCGCVGAQGQPGVCDPACKYGKCENGRCVCDEGFTGDDCSERACPDNCKDRGDCVNGVCVCKPGFTGADCSLRACVPDCGDRGRCVDGVCQCEPGYEGPTCTSRSCPGNCMGRGVCVDGVCQCEPGFTGPDCSSTSCPNDCFGRGVCVDGVCQCEPGFVGEDCSAELSVPGPITGVFTRDITINSIFIGWVEEDYVDKYHLEYRRTNELNGWNEIEVFDPGYTVTGLASATEYQFRVSGENVKGRGEPSEVVEVATKEDLGSIAPKGAPGAASAVTRDASSLLVEWEAPTLPEGSPDLLGFRLFWRRVGEGEYQTVEVGPEELSYVLMDLDTFTEYEMYIVAFNANGDGPNSDTFTAMTAEGVPGAPVGLMGEAVDSQSITVRWNEPERTMGVITGYKITYQPEGGAPAEALVPGSDRSHLLTGLTPYTVYTIYVVGLTSQGEGERSDSVTVRTFEGVPDAPRDFEAEAVDATSIQVSWEPPANTNGELQGYKILYRQAGTEAISIAEVAPAAQYHLLTELQPFTVYLLALVAFTEGGEGETSSEVTVQTDEDVPSPPQDVTVEPIDSTSARVVWQPPAEPNGILQGYKVLYKDSNAAEYITHEVEASEMSYVISDMIPGTEYVVAVSAFTGAGDGSPSEELRIQTEEGVPDVPTSVVAEGIDAQSIRVSWQPSTETNGVLLGYYIYYTPEGSDEEQRAQVEPTDTSYVVGGLQPFTVYIISVSGFTAAGEGDRSDETRVQTLQGVPASPTGLGATPVDPRTVRVEWQPPQQPNGEIQGYNIYYRTTESDEDALQQAGAQDIFLTLTGLSPFTEYTIRVSALTGVGEGQTSDSVTVLTPAGAPSFPMDVEANAVDSQSIRINWQPPTEPNGNVLGYNIFYTTEGENSNNRQTVGPDDTTYVIEGLRPATQYAITLNAFTEAGEGERTEERVVTTLTDVPGAPASIEATAVDTTSIRVEWQAPSEMGGTLLGYKIYYQLVGQDSPSTADVEPTEISYLLTELQPYSEYLIWLVGYTEAGEGDSTEQVTVQTPQGVPAAPTDLQASAIDARTIQVYWQQPQQANGNLLGYKLFYQGFEDEDVTVLEIPSTDTSWLLSGLQPATEYLIWVVAYTGAGDGERPNEVIVQTLEGVPDAPRDIVASATNPTTIRVKWHAPRQTNGVLLGYKVFYKHTADDEIQAAVVAPNKLNHTNIDVDQMTEYVVTVSAFTSAGDGPESRPVTVRTQEGVPSSPFGLYAYALDTDSISISWQLPLDPNGVIEGYNLYYEADGSEDEEMVQVGPEDGVNSPYVLAGLQPYTLYSLEIAGVTGGGEGDRSDQVKVTTLEGAPSTPLGATAEGQAPDTIQVTWQPPTQTNGDLLGYYIYYQVVGSTEELRAEAGPIETTYSISGLQPATEYIITLTAYTEGGESERSGEVLVSTLSGAPSAPLSVSAQGQGPDTVIVAWQTPAETNGDLLGYYVYYKAVESTDVSRAEAGPDDATYIISGLRPATEYVVTLTAYTEGGESEHSGEALVSTLSGVPGAPTDVKGHAVEPTTITVDWQPPLEINGVLLGYKVIYMPENAAEFSTVELGPAELSTMLLDLEPSTTYSIVVLAFTSAGDGDESEEILVSTMQGVPGAPTDLSAVETTSNSMKLSWQAPEGDIEGYRVFYSLTGSDTEEAVDTRSADASWSLSGLQPFGEYSISVLAYNSAGDGERSETITVQTEEGVPGAPREVQGLAIDSTTIELQWMPPSPDEQNGVIKGYKILYKKVGEEGENEEDAGLLDLMYTLSDLEKWTEYNIWVSAYTSAGDGLRSPVIVVRTGEDVPGPPIGIEARPGDDSASVLVQWQQPIVQNGVIVGYKILYQKSGDEDVEETDIGTPQLAFTLGGLDWDDYNVWVVAYTGAGDGDRSDPVLVRPAEGVPSVGPGNLNAEAVDAGSIRVSWTRISDAEAGGALQGYQVFYQAIPADGALEISDAQVYKVEGADTLEATLTGLEAGTRYAITVSGYTSRGTGIRADLVEATTQTGIPYPNPTDCGQVVANGETESGPFTVYPSDGGEPIEVWCDMETDGGGWIVFQRRQDGSVDFWRRWREYRAGFGENTGEFWLGNENIHRLSHQGDYQLRIDLADGTDAVYGEWDNFKLGSESDLYKLNIGEYSGTSGDSLTYHNNRPFSTRDKDNDVALSHCAFAYHGAWWYKNCHRSNLNGQYGDNTHSQGVNWYHWKGHEKSVPFVEMKMRSMDFKTKYARAE